ncbi:N5-carboxyaminoimidazole ribonucleotide synthase [Croceibacterium atlanticum]|uniref:N5-carboxyaminoimidazole ribonucleotide synthase n=2 Tax=Croceibacterium atlanticum TaxID=1267766 RepID=A0A0F7KXA0_9SPHN|nr:N5-carboxyaminoimidazole ribonucleotide synthase [Croceibacterium atlanticum]
MGGGQLGRMIAMAAAQLGYRCHIYAPEKHSIAAEVSAGFTCASWLDQAALSEFAQNCAVVTYEFENVPVAPLAAIPEDRMAPGKLALEIAQDRLKEKQFIADLGGRPAPYARVDTEEGLRDAVEQVGMPGILKTRRDGYDGKGQWRIHSLSEMDGVRVPQGGLIYEGFVRFEAEFSVILVRARDGSVKFWDSAQNIHKNGILAESRLPAPKLVGEQVEEARELARQAADALNYVGVLALEFFATAEGPVFNEMAPRVHNSGHWTSEGAVTSQFENHVRAICGLPLGDTSTVSTRVEMRNLIGGEAADIASLLADPRAHLHLYGKAEAREGRKMGHVTKVG